MSDELRRKWRQYWDDRDSNEEAYVASGLDPSMKPPYVPLPEELSRLTCGAKTRAGTPCKLKGLFRSGRCKLHGGLSTGPRTEAGKKRSARNGSKKKGGHVGGS